MKHQTTAAPHSARLASLTAALTLGATSLSAAIVTLNFEGIPSDYQFAGLGLNLGSYYAAEPNGPVFGPGVNALEPVAPYPPASGVAGVFSPNESRIEVAFALPVEAVSVYYRSASQLYLYAYDMFDNLLGDDSGPSNLAPDSAGYLSFDAGLGTIAKVVIQDSGGFYIIDDFSYRHNPIPEPHEYALIAGLGLAGFAVWRRRRA